MKNMTMVILGVLLLAAVIFGAVIYPRHLETKEALSTSEQEISELKEENQRAKEKYSKLQNRVRDRAVASRKGQKDTGKRVSDLQAELSSSDATVSELRDSHQNAESQIRLLKDEIAEGKSDHLHLEEVIAKGKADRRLLEVEIDEGNADRERMEKEIAEGWSVIKGLNSQIMDLKAQKSTAEGQMGRLGKLEKELEEKKNANKFIQERLATKEDVIKGLQEKYKISRKNVQTIEEEVEKRRSEVDRLQRRMTDLSGQKRLAESQIGQMKTTYESLLSDLEKQIQNQEVTIRAYKEKISVTFVDRILFGLGKATITPGGKRVLKQVGQILKDVRDKQIRVVGHTDDIPITAKYRFKYPSNWELSAARAAAVVRYFQNDIGVDPGNLEAVGQSYYKPIASNTTKDGRAQNRRVNIIIAPRIE